MIKLQWLRINKFRRVRPGTHLTFNPGYNVLLGQNGTGKTTLLNLIAAIFNWDFSEIDEEFDLEYEFQVLDVLVRTSARNEQRTSSPVELDLRAALSGENPRSGFRRFSNDVEKPTLFAKIEVRWLPHPPLVLTVDGAEADVVVESETAPGRPVSLRIPRGSPLSTFFGGGLLEWRRRGGAVSLNALMSWIGVWSSGFGVCRFDESLGFYERMCGVELKTIQWMDDFVEVKGSPLAQALSLRIEEVSRERWSEDRYVLSGKDIPFLGRLAGLLGFDSADVVVEFDQIEKLKSGEGLKSGGQKFLFTHRGGWRLSEKSLSYGQKRMLAFLYYLDCVKPIAIADELVNGLHHGWIQACVEELEGRQVFLTSQNPLLLDYLSFSSAEDVRSQFVLTRWEQEAEQMVWENMSQEAAEDFFSSYKIGFQQVGELLQSKGLW